MSESPQPVNLFFRLTAGFGALFVITVFALLAVPFGHSDAPVARFLNDYGGRLLAVEVVLVLAAGFLAMAVDRQRPSCRPPDGAAEDEAGDSSTPVAEDSSGNDQSR